MNDSLNRIASYLNWPIVEGLYATELAENGFYFTGQGDEVKCFMCGVVLGNWQSGENPFERHRQSSPNCVLVGVSSTRGTTFNAQSNSNSSSLTSLSNRSSSVLSSNRSSSIASGCKSSVSQVETIEVVSASAETELSTVKDITVETMKSEAARLATFATWPKTDIVAPKLLACEGFFYVGPNDRVKCAFCDGELENWVKGDDPIREHTRNYSNCPFVQGLEVGNKSVGKRDQHRKQNVHKMPSGELHQCAVCLTDNISVAFEPCGHACTCAACAGKITACPLCRKIITKRIRIYLS